MYQRKVSYTYTYNNLAYTNMHASLASSVASTSSWLVRKSTTAYQDGATVKVWVNPDNPSQATLEPRTGFVWVLWLVAAAIWGVAYYAAVARLAREQSLPLAQHRLRSRQKSAPAGPPTPSRPPDPRSDPGGFRFPYSSGPRASPCTGMV